MIIIDSNVLIAYSVEEDSNHFKAVDLVKRITNGELGAVFISDYIFDETVTVIFVKSRSIYKAEEVGSYILSATNMLKVDKEEFEMAWNIFKAQQRSKFSFTDCTILSIMNYNNIENIATFDKEFKTIKTVNVIE